MKRQTKQQIIDTLRLDREYWDKKHIEVVERKDVEIKTLHEKLNQLENQVWGLNQSRNLWSQWSVADRTGELVTLQFKHEVFDELHSLLR